MLLWEFSETSEFPLMPTQSTRGFSHWGTAGMSCRTSLRGATWRCDVCTHRKAATTRRPAALLHSATEKCCVCDKEFYSLGNFQTYNTVLTIVTTLQITFQDLFLTKSLYFWPLSPISSNLFYVVFFNSTYEAFLNRSLCPSPSQ